MASKDINESQQASEGKAIGTQGNQGGTVPTRLKGPHYSKEDNKEHPIPNQDHSSASNANKNSDNNNQ